MKHVPKWRLFPKTHGLNSVACMATKHFLRLHKRHRCSLNRYRRQRNGGREENEQYLKLKFSKNTTGLPRNKTN